MTIARMVAHSVLAAICLIGNASFAQAQTATPQPPPEEQALMDVLSKYNRLYDAAPNDIQQAKLSPEFVAEFCSKIPTSPVSKWVGTIDTLNSSDDGGINLKLQLTAENFYSSSLGLGLWMGNIDAQYPNTQPHAATEIAPNTPLFNTVSNMRVGDTVIFSGSFIPFIDSAACQSWVDDSNFSLFRFSNVQDIGVTSGY